MDVKEYWFEDSTVIHIGSPAMLGKDDDILWDTAKKWCLENCKGKFRMGYSRHGGSLYDFEFEIKTEATLFALKFV